MSKKIKFETMEELEHQLQLLKFQNVRKVELDLSESQKDFLVENGYILEPILFQIKTKRFSNIKEQPSLIQEIHKMCKRNKMLEVRPLKKKERELLKKAGVKVRGYRYIVYL